MYFIVYICTQIYTNYDKYNKPKANKKNAIAY